MVIAKIVRSVTPSMFFCCLVYATNPNDEIFEKLSTNLAKKGDRIIQNIERTEGQSIQIEVLVSMEGSFPKLSKIIRNFKEYNSWVLRDINTDARGSKLICEFLQVVHSADPETLTLDYKLHIPLNQMRALRSFLVKSEGDSRTVRLMGKAISPDSSWDSFGELRMYPATDEENRVWVYARGKFRVKNWLIYAAFPEKVLHSEIAPRVHALITSLQRQERLP